MQLDPNALLELAHAKMPFGKYKDYYLVDIPEPYYVWFKQKGFPTGKLGMQMQSMYEIKLNELESLVRKIKDNYPKPSK
ncbi:hypothetical protein SAMN05216480_103224 [Pustulibacterium marinum]|uniref:DUF3820 family protein n=1 Tax=Pustulibacterium marinum TaxID=1224947 RepID=A0A1I7G691_9FLAO|nr:DUF3820 family protein [Pustulibacterium marinum]SFU43928.1 hypothetical protein SAMN05216480_103224 [Pustulibacterium marinum]